jgi:carboxyl-terminal processing protease
MLKRISIATVFLFSGLSVFAQSPVAVVEKPALDPSVRTEAFEKVWNTVNEKHYDPSFGGVDWRKVRESYLPKAMAAKTDEELHAVLRKMLSELKLSHYGIYPRDLASRISGNAGIGVELKMIDGQPVVYRVEPGSTGAAAGLKPGLVVQKVDGKTVAELLKPLEASLAERQLSDRMKTLYRERTTSAFITGAVDTKVTVEVQSDKGSSMTVTAVRKAFTGEMSQAIGNFPAQRVEFESKLLDNNIGYIRFNMWVIPQLPKIRAAIREFANARGIIFDLRGNPGGVGGMAPGVAGNLTDRQISLGSMTSRESSVNFIAYPQQQPFAGPVVILTDYGTGSTSEVFAAGMQEIGRATIIGETSAGAVLPSVFDTLPTGAIFQYAISDYRSPKNVLIEGRGVVPNIKVLQTRADLLAGRDPQLEAAVKQILK